MDNYTFTRQHRGPLVETINAIWAEDNAVAAVDELLAQLQQLAEDDLGSLRCMTCGSRSPTTSDRQEAPRTKELFGPH